MNQNQVQTIADALREEPKRVLPEWNGKEYRRHKYTPDGKLDLSDRPRGEITVTKNTISLTVWYRKQVVPAGKPDWSWTPCSKQYAMTPSRARLVLSLKGRLSEHSRRMACAVLEKKA